MPAPHSGVLIKSQLVPLCQFAGFHGNLPGSLPPRHWAFPAGPNVESGATEASVGVCREEQLEWGVQLPILQMRTFGEQKLSDLLKTPSPSGAEPGLGPVSAGGLSSSAFLSIWLSLLNPAGQVLRETDLSFSSLGAIQPVGAGQQASAGFPELLPPLNPNSLLSKSLIL